MAVFSSKRVLAVDIGAGELKLAEFNSGGAGLELTKLAVCPLGVEPDRDLEMPLAIVEALRSVLAEKKIRPAPVALSITGPSAFLRLVKLPPISPHRIYQTVLYEAQQHVPFPIDEVIWDYQLIGTSQHELDVMLVAVKTDIVQNMTDCVEAAGLSVEMVDVAPLALYNAVRYNYPDLDGCSLVLDIGARSTNLIFIEEGRPFTRILPIVGTGNAITQQLMKEFNLPFNEAEELKQAHARVAFGGAYEDYSDKVISRVSKTVRNTLTRLHLEVERSINFYRTQHGGSSPARIFLAGGTSVIARTNDFFREKLKVDVEYLNPFSNIVVHEDVTADEVGACAHVMGPAVGMGLRHMLPCPVEINLLPSKIARERAFARRQPYLIAAGIGLVLAALCWWSYFVTMGHRLAERREVAQSVVAKLEFENARLKKVEMQKELLRQRAGELAHAVRVRAGWLRVLNGLADCLPGGAWLVSIAPDVKEAATAPAARYGRATPEGVEAEAAATGITRLRVRGMLFRDQENEQNVAPIFCDRLQQHPLFSKKTKIELMPQPLADDFIREFTILVELREPL